MGPRPSPASDPACRRPRTWRVCARSWPTRESNCGRCAGGTTELEAIAQREGLEFEAPPPGEELAQRRALRSDGETALSDAARSMVADFAGARGDIAQRRRRGEASVPRLPESPRKRSVPAPLHAVDAAPTTLYHAATLRGGQALHHTGNIVVVGDVNPGAELIASGDIVVFGAIGRHRARRRAGRRERPRLRARTDRDAVAHRDIHRRGSRAASAAGARKPEAAVAQGGRIAVFALDRLGDVAQAGAPTP